MRIKHPSCALSDSLRQVTLHVHPSLIFIPPAGIRSSSSRLVSTAAAQYRPSSLLGASRYRSPNNPSLERYSTLVSPTSLMTRTSSTPANTSLNRRPDRSNMQRARTYSQSQSRRSSMYRSSVVRTSMHGSNTTLQLSWLFRSNIPSRRGLPLPSDTQKRNFFGMGEIIGVLANPSETLRSLTESKRMLEETRRELAEAKERAQLSPTHTFSPLPGFFDRPAELKAIERALDGDPSFTVVFGASSVGKTALLRQVLTRSQYHVLHFDLRIAGFADLPSLYFSLSQQMESFFMSIAQDPDMPGYGDFEKEAWGFKHDRLSVERRMSNAANGDGSGSSVLGEIKTSDVARLMELFQSSLLRYWKFQPDLGNNRRSKGKDKSNVETASTHTDTTQTARKSPRIRWSWLRPKKKDSGHEPLLKEPAEKSAQEQKKTPLKKMPIFFIDEAHKLPALIRSTDAMKCLLDAMLVITKQDRLCHVIHATSDPFYQTWLRQLNVMQHCKIITIGDYPKYETRRYFSERILPNVPQRLRRGLDFEKLYDAFGGKLAHWQDYISDYVNASGRLDVKQCSHFLQAHALLNLHVIHSAQSPPPGEGEGDRSRGNASPQNMQRVPSTQPLTSGTGFRIYSPLTLNADPDSSPSPFSPAGTGPDTTAEFNAIQLLKVMNRLTQPGTRALSYFLLCREMGARAIDGMVRGRILDLHWSDPVTREGWDPRGPSIAPRESTHVARVAEAGSSGTMVNDIPEQDEDGDMVALSPDEIYQEEQRAFELADEEQEILGPKLVPTTPIMRFAMREVVQEYYDDDDQTVSEYESLSEVEEY